MTMPFAAIITTLNHQEHETTKATRIDDHDRAGLERLIRYATRPPLGRADCRSSMSNG